MSYIRLPVRLSWLWRLQKACPLRAVLCPGQGILNCIVEKASRAETCSSVFLIMRSMWSAPSNVCCCDFSHDGLWPPKPSPLPGRETKIVVYKIITGTTKSNNLVWNGQLQLFRAKYQANSNQFLNKGNLSVLTQILFDFQGTIFFKTLQSFKNTLTCLLPEKVGISTVMAHIAMETVVGHKR